MYKFSTIRKRVGVKTPLFFIAFLLAASLAVLLVNRSVSAPSQHLSTRQQPNVNTIKKAENATQMTSPIYTPPPSFVNLPSAHQSLSSSSDTQLQKLAQYEQQSGGAVAYGMMVFTDMPDSANDAKNSATDMYHRLQEFAKYGLKPVVIMEPTNSSGSINFSTYKSGAYDPILNTYFQTLKNLGLSDKTLGMWTYFPEANLPEWGPVDRADFAPNVVHSVQIQKNFFPASQASILLDAESYPDGSSDWSDGSYVSLAPFINGIPQGLLNSFGLQGFPWAPPANQAGESPSYNPVVFLNSSLASAAAEQLGTPNVWFNTGTFAAMYTNSTAQTVFLSAAQRQTILTGVVAQASNLKKSGFNVAVNLFSEDKSKTNEATDWSYKSATDQAVFKSFAGQLNAAGIEMWLFDD